jgi:hypothetical protein
LEPLFQFVRSSSHCAIRRSLIGYVLRLEYASGTSDYRRNLNTRGLRLNVSALGLRGRPGFLDLLHDGVAIPPGETVRLEYPAAVTIFSRSQVASTQSVKVVLDALIFANSQFAGPDMGQSFEVLADQLIAEQETRPRCFCCRNDPAKRETILAEVTLLAQPRAPVADGRPGTRVIAELARIAR